MDIRRRSFAAFTLGAWQFLGVHGLATGQDAWPSKPVRIVIGFSAGGGTDTVLRAISVKLGEALKTTVVVENRPGANANIAAEHVAKAPADGYTFLYNTSSIVTSQFLYPKLNYSLAKDFTPVALTVNVPMVLVVGPTVKAPTVKELVAEMAAAPNTLTYAAAGAGNITHLSSLLFQRAFNVRGVNITYKGEGPGLSDVMAGHVHYAVSTAAGVSPLVKDKRLRALAVFSANRVPAFPEVPTSNEIGAGHLELGSWSGIMAPAGTPPDIVQKMNVAVNAVLKDAALLQTFAANSAIPKGGSVEDYAIFLRRESERWGAIIKTENIRGE
jgi:tripartite-type tricarboxylate transporter receptor subunit TctC